MLESLWSGRWPMERGKGREEARRAGAESRPGEMCPSEEEVGERGAEGVWRAVWPGEVEVEGRAGVGKQGMEDVTWRRSYSKWLMWVPTWSMVLGMEGSPREEDTLGPVR